ncbi:BirA family biotin operon repressor/biotin-[acetyl-CoA-carboxylase] ligase [Cryobacterium sp. MP_3.1]|uniref:biotin--[acetyl-CoA-carboxylase] ligase n=1 Tax=unclassified Cryobacterium TaxID=2649013 RepID=UPI000B4DA701|nr:MULTISPECIES: biotin--[acetyl-CoA-carboxylase] ligase [unclassified Cryobacterium]ASD21186.1 biotin--[acetyl-CoA-carboxylase] ligase [Cryobacterium sp. LW097]MEC5183121.1 BirA family biotin operon repressor/biotin-[acetyl-CoA-carboxylase] ligase [Cryobacterium sp. MP_3.1]TFC56456.1 biotin--[acetyl-CoA-carboxylase] ligase [Cryobacterium sp. TMB3-1-2]TFC56571.1 biotin--[acetyl-CoA-carboxylase] ligase [Cryobacterium sp. TMB1-7]TFC67339.1 biotin--[acetyl-CoA-carboxylase] ligase [Cryobacterium s
MEFPISRGIGARFEYLDEAGSTNDVLVTRATGPDASAWPDLSVIVTDNQTSGRGRLGRTWLAPSGKSLAISVLLRPRLESGRLPPNRYGWFPLLAGAAMTQAVRSVVQAAAPPPGDEEAPRHEVTLKWPNDVLIDGYKVSGILSELLPDASGLCIGTGLNLSLDEHDLPTLTSTSLMLVTGSIPNADEVLAAYLDALRSLTANFLAAGADPVASGLHAEVSALCGTLGAAVRVELPGGQDLVGTAVGLDGDGRLIVEDQTNGELQAVAAGDVTHLRY